MILKTEDFSEEIQKRITEAKQDYEQLLLTLLDVIMRERKKETISDEYIESAILNVASVIVCGGREVEEKYRGVHQPERWELMIRWGIEQGAKSMKNADEKGF